MGLIFGKLGKKLGSSEELKSTITSEFKKNIDEQIISYLSNMKYKCNNKCEKYDSLIKLFNHIYALFKSTFKNYVVDLIIKKGHNVLYSNRNLDDVHTYVNYKTGKIHIPPNSYKKSNTLIHIFKYNGYD